MRCPFFVHFVEFFLKNVQEFFTNYQKDLVYYTYSKGAMGKTDAVEISADNPTAYP